MDNSMVEMENLKIEENSKYQCDVCQLVLKNDRVQKHHFESVHGGVKSFKCRGYNDIYLCEKWTRYVAKELKVDRLVLVFLLVLKLRYGKISLKTPFTSLKTGFSTR